LVDSKSQERLKATGRRLSPHFLINRNPDLVYSKTNPFLIGKRGIFRRGKKAKESRGGVHRYAAQAISPADAATAEKYRVLIKN